MGRSPLQQTRQPDEFDVVGVDVRHGIGAAAQAGHRRVSVAVGVGYWPQRWLAAGMVAPPPAG